jgi:hypothetical protein
MDQCRIQLVNERRDCVYRSLPTDVVTYSRTSGLIAGHFSICIFVPASYLRFAVDQQDHNPQSVQRLMGHSWFIDRINFWSLP